MQRSTSLLFAVVGAGLLAWGLSTQAVAEYAAARFVSLFLGILMLVLAFILDRH